MWVLELEGEQVSRNTHTELLSMIVERHETQVLGHPIQFDRWTERFK
jgi:hypothetical protein